MRANTDKIRLADVMQPRGTTWKGACSVIAPELLADWIGDGVTPEEYAIKPVEHEACTPYMRLVRLLQDDMFTETELLLVYLLLAKRRTPEEYRPKIQAAARYVLGQIPQAQVSAAVAAHLPSGFTTALWRDISVEKFHNLVNGDKLSRWKAAALALVFLTGEKRLDLLRRAFARDFKKEDCQIVGDLFAGRLDLYAELGV